MRVLKRFFTFVFASFGFGHSAAETFDQEAVDRRTLIERALEYGRLHGAASLLADIRRAGENYQTDSNFLYCIDRQGVVLAHAISGNLQGTELRNQLNGEPLRVLEILLKDLPSRPAGQVQYRLNPRLKVEMSYQVLGEIILIAQSKLIPANLS